MLKRCCAYQSVRSVSIPADNDAKPTVLNGPALAFHLGMMVGERHAPASPPIVVTVNVDEVIEESFPASDPPSWTPGIARPAPVDARAADGPERFVLTVTVTSI